MPEDPAANPSVIAIACEPLALQLALTGMHVEHVTDATEAEALLDQYLESEVRLLVVQEQLRDTLSTFVRDRLAAHRGLPLIVCCPEFDKEESEVDDYLAAVLKPAIGYVIRLE